MRDERPWALIITALPGVAAEVARLPMEQERAVWRDAGKALGQLHTLPPNDPY